MELYFSLTTVLNDDVDGVVLKMYIMALLAIFV